VLAAVAPPTPGSAPKSDLKQVLEEIDGRGADGPQLTKIGDRGEIAPSLEGSLDRGRNRRRGDRLLEAELQPASSIEALELEMTPIEPRWNHRTTLDELELHLDDGTLQEIERQIHEQLEPLQEELERLHVSMAPQLEQIEPSTRDGALGERLEKAIRDEVAAVLREHLASVTDPEAPLRAVAGHLLNDASINVNGSVVRCRCRHRMHAKSCPAGSVLTASAAGDLRCRCRCCRDHSLGPRDSGRLEER
jgi:hypothetical protein